MLPHNCLICVISCINVALLLTIHIAPGWALYESSVQHYHSGLWTICSPDKCNLLKVKAVNLNLIRSFMVLALLSCFLGILCSVNLNYFKDSMKHFFKQSLATAVCNILTGVFVLIAVVIFEISMAQSKSLKPIPKQWAFYISCVVCIMSFLAGTYGVILYKQSRQGATEPPSQANPE